MTAFNGASLESSRAQTLSYSSEKRARSASSIPCLFGVMVRVLGDCWSRLGMSCGGLSALQAVAGSTSYKVRIGIIMPDWLKEYRDHQ